MEATMRRDPDRRRCLSIGVAIGLACLVAGSSCGPPPPPRLIAREGRDPAVPTPAEILGELRTRADSLRTFRAGLDLIWEDSRFPEAESCRGSLSWQAPDRLRLRGHTAALFTVFDLVASGPEVRLDVPREKLFVHGRRDDPAWSRLPFPPELLRVAILADPCPPEGSAGASGGGADSALVVETADFRLDVDPVNRLPLRYTAGDIEIRWIEWMDRRGTAWPQRVEIRGIGGGGILRIEVGRLVVNRAIPASRFRLEPDDDREVLTPEEAAARWTGGAAAGTN